MSKAADERGWASASHGVVAVLLTALTRGLKLPPWTAAVVMGLGLFVWYTITTPSADWWSRRDLWSRVLFAVGFGLFGAVYRIYGP